MVTNLTCQLMKTISGTSKGFLSLSRAWLLSFRGHRPRLRDEDHRTVLSFRPRVIRWCFLHHFIRLKVSASRGSRPRKVGLHEMKEKTIQLQEKKPLETYQPFLKSINDLTMSLVEIPGFKGLCSRTLESSFIHPIDWRQF